MESAARGGGRRKRRDRARDRVGGEPAPTRWVPPGPGPAAPAALAAASGPLRAGHRLPFPSGGSEGRSLRSRTPPPHAERLSPAAAESPPPPPCDTAPDLSQGPEGRGTKGRSRVHRFFPTWGSPGCTIGGRVDTCLPFSSVICCRRCQVHVQLCLVGTNNEHR